MREIKFRAWDPACDHMIYSDCAEEDYWWRIGEDGISIEWYDPCIVKLTPDGPVETDGWVEISNSVVMEYTGNKDKNGKEIYESDIIQIKDRFVMWSRSSGQIVEDVNAIVVWGGTGFIPRRSANTRLWILDMEQYEVVGNIYENPELLEVVR